MKRDMRRWKGQLGEEVSWEVSPLSCSRGVETMMEEAGFVVFFFSCLSTSSQLLLFFCIYLISAQLSEQFSVKREANK